MRAFGLCLLFPFAVAAQVSDDPGSAGTNRFDEIRVEGRTPDPYRIGRSAAGGALGERDLLDTPHSINVVTGELIADQQARLLLEVLRNDPSAAAGFGAGLSSVQQVSLRGYAVAFDTNYRRDGLTFARFSETPFETVDRVEVLKGLSGFLYGFAAPGGIVNIVPKTPTEQPLRALRVGYSGESLFALHGDLGGRAGDDGRYGYRVNLAMERGGAAIRDLDVERLVGSAYVDARVTDTLTLALDVETHGHRPEGQPLYYRLDAGVAVPRPPKQRRFNGVSFATYDTEDRTIGLHAEWHFAADWSARVSTLDYQQERDAWFSEGIVLNADGDLSVHTQRDLFQEFPARSVQLLVSGDVATGALRHEIHVGANRVRREAFRGEYAFSDRFDSNLYAPVVAPFTDLVAAGPKYRNRDAMETGLFAANTVHVNEHVQVLAGVRRASFDVRSFNADGALTQRYDRSATTPSVAAIFKPRPELALYASYAEGLEQGGIAPASADNAGEVFDPLKSEQIEVGLKWEPTRLLGLNLAVFDIDKGLGFVEPASNRFTQRGRQVHRGVEFTLAGQPLPRLNLVAGSMWLDAEAKRTGNPAIDGDRPVGVPEWTANFYADYDLAAVPRLALSAGLQYVGAREIDANNDRRINAVTLVNFGARYAGRLGARNLIWRAGIDNVTDRNYWAAATGGAILHGGLPRTVKLSVQIE